MSDLIVLGTDTDAGKTTFSLLWLAAFKDDYAYWKPVETGLSDTGTVRRLVPGVRAFDPVAHFDEAVAPSLAARNAGRTIPPASAIAAQRPAGPLLIETFGGPLSPLNETELQIELVLELGVPAVLVTGSHVGAVGRTLATLRAVQDAAVPVRGVALIGMPDPYAVEQITKYARLPVASLTPPTEWDAAGVAAAAGQIDELRRFHAAVVPPVVRGSLGDWVSRDRASVWHPYTSLQDSADPLPVLAARDEFLTLTDGRQLVDGISSWWTILHGHRNPALVAALQSASELIDHVLFAGVTHPYAVEYAEGLLKTAPWPGGRVFYSDNGSTAVEVALKMAYQTWCHRGEANRTLFVGFDGAYHGDTFGTMSVGRDPTFFGRFEPLLFRALQVPVDPNRLDDVLQKHAGTVAAVVIEPLVQGAGGMRMHTPQALRDLYDVTRRRGVLFVADEVMTGSRTGSFWAHTQAGIAPDLICAAKTLAGGVLPLAVTLASPEIVAAFDTADRTRTFFHGHSFTANPLACAVALANIRMMAGGDWLVDSNRIAHRWAAAVNSLKPLPGVADVRTCGTILAVELGAEGGYLAEVGRTLRTAAVANGVLLRPLGNVLYAMPPLCTSDRSLDLIVQAMHAAVRTAAR
ncbi:MAG TPA: adenosylmethionine--8-amino-7-oxononanoate transaminase [Gemmataceae bacterium]|nr:adenosylmethionine--8-amino-7-oxononanoate transaminase [Gemmataceae bacterium]